MKQLSEAELNAKIHRFLDNRLTAYPELGGAEQMQAKLSERVVSRVKNISRRFTGAPTKSRTIFQS